MESHNDTIQETNRGIMLRVPNWNSTAILDKPDDDQTNQQSYSIDEREYEKATRILRHRLKIYFNAAMRYRDSVCSFQPIYFIFMLLQILRVILITVQMFHFRNDRVDFNNVVHRGHLTLRHVVLKDWSAHFETLPYPPSHGDFAVYDIKSLKEKINYAVTNLYNAEADAIGYFKNLTEVRADMKYYDLNPKSEETFENGLKIRTTSFIMQADRISVPSLDRFYYSYDIDKDLERNNLSYPFGRLLKLTLVFKIYSLRVDTEAEKARCLYVDGWIWFDDPEDTGQMIQNLETLTHRIKCADMGMGHLKDRNLETVEIGVSVMVLLLGLASVVFTVIRVAYGIVVLFKTKAYMKKYYKKYYEPEDPAETDLPIRQYVGFFTGWDGLVLVADLNSIIGTFGMALKLKDKTWTLETLESYAVILGIGCLLSWIGLLRYLNVNYKFHMLFYTMYNSAWDVLAYLLCIMLLFTGYMSFGYLVFGPYHVKFQSPSAATTTLFALINGDEIYATFALLDDFQTGGPLIVIVYQFYLGSYISIFTIIVINLLIALFTNTYESVKTQYEDSDDRTESPMERALKQILTSNEHGDYMALKSNVYKIIKGDDNNRHSFAENKLRTELSKSMRITEESNKIILKKPRTIKAFILDEDQEEISHDKLCCPFKFLGVWGSDVNCFY